MLILSQTLLNTQDWSLALFIGGASLFAALFLLLFQLLKILIPELNPVQQRIDTLTERHLQAGVRRKRTPSWINRYTDPFLRSCQEWGQNFYAGSAKLKQETKDLLQQAGKPSGDQAVKQFLGKRMATAIALSVLMAIVMAPMGQPLMWLVGIIGGFYVGGLLVYMQLKSKANERKTRLRRGLPDALDLMVVCVEAGLGLDTTIKRVSQEIQTLAPDLSDEFKRVSQELNAGLAREEVLKSLGTRNGVDELRSLCMTLIQSDRLGTSVGDALRIYAEDMRDRRKQRAEEQAAKASVKMTIPLVLFIFPPLMIVLLGPVVLNAMKSFGA